MYGLYNIKIFLGPFKYERVISSLWHTGSNVYHYIDYVLLRYRLKWKFEKKKIISKSLIKYCYMKSCTLAHWCLKDISWSVNLPSHVFWFHYHSHMTLCELYSRHHVPCNRFNTVSSGRGSNISAGSKDNKCWFVSNFECKTVLTINTVLRLAASIPSMGQKRYCFRKVVKLSLDRISKPIQFVHCFAT